MWTYDRFGHIFAPQKSEKFSFEQSETDQDRSCVAFSGRRKVVRDASLAKDKDEKMGVWVCV